MFRRFVMLAAAVSILGFSVGCGGPGDATTIKAEDRPADLNKPVDGKTNIGPGGEDLPHNVNHTE